MKVAIGCDHAGYDLMSEVREAITELGHEVLDQDVCHSEPVDYPDVAATVCRAIQNGQAETGILICGTGIGMSMAANKMRGIRAARAEDCYSASMARLHNGAQVLTMGGRVTGPGVARDVVCAFLSTEMSGDERHCRRRDKIMALEGEA
jgi:ribose 5-phosphate isomerase B